MPDTYTFNGNIVTLLGLIGIVSTAIITVVAYHRYWNSPYRR
jgi:cell division protein FtsL